MKVAIVIGSLNRGGSERQVAEFVRATHPGHAECVVICLRGGGALAPEVRATGAKVHELDSKTVRSPRLLVALARRLRRERPDVVYAFLFWGYALALPIASLAVPRALRVQGRRSLPADDVPRRRAQRHIRRVCDRFAHAAIVNSIQLGAAVGQAAPRLSGRIWVVPNGVRRVPPRAAAPAGPTVRMVCVANLIHYKGHATLLAAVGRLPRTGPDWRLQLVGEGAERAAIEADVARLDLGQHVELLGRRPDVDAILETADIVVHPSYTEGMPNAVLEAMAHGVPVVATDVGGVRSLLGSGAGLVIPPRDDASLAAALQTLLADAPLRRRLGDHGARMVREELGTDAMRDRTLSAFAEIGSVSRRPGRL